MTCRCHADAVYAGLTTCPGCGHNSYDPIANACERRGCGYVDLANPTLWPEASGR